MPEQQPSCLAIALEELLPSRIYRIPLQNVAEVVQGNSGRDAKCLACKAVYNLFIQGRGMNAVLIEADLYVRTRALQPVANECTVYDGNPPAHIQ